MPRKPKSDVSGEFWFDEAAADRACRFFPKYLKHVKGEGAGQPFELLPWAKDQLVRPLFGWKRSDGTRRYRTCYVEIPRKNAKSTISAGLALALLFIDNEAGAEVYSAAGDREQAAIVFNAASEMVAASPELRRRSRIFRRAIINPALGASYKVLSADAPRKHGLNAHGIIFDELHVQPNRDLWDTLTTSTGARRQPLTIALTTAGYDRNSICWEVHDYAVKVQKGIVKDPSFLPVIFAADESDDWTKPETWRKANPSMGMTISEEYLARECKKAQEIAAYENTFKRLHLNLWTKSAKRWMAIDRWDASAGVVEEEDLKGMECIGGLDLASRQDIAAWVMLFQGADGEYKVLPRFFVPEDAVAERSRKDHVDYETWARLGLIIATPGDEIDYAAIRKQIFEDADRFRIREVAYDRWGATQLVQDLQAEGLNVVPVGQGFASMASPTKELITLVRAGKFHHGGNPVLRWMADNMSLRQDPAGNLKPDKEKSSEKIDGLVAAVMALGRWLVGENVGGGGAYQDGNLTVF
jgi:phage terminase large subunit-like protein